MDDSFVQQLTWGVLACALPLLALLGHWPRLTGRYGEGDRIMQLGHIGPLVWGHCALLDGRERYLGWALAGRLHLRRYDWGAGHLIGRGFPKEQVRALEGVCTGFFVLHAASHGDLTGHFYGRRFRMEGHRVVHVESLAPQGRHWRRLV